MLRESHVLLFSIFIAGLCSLVYELLIATTTAYFLGDSITQFSLTIGIYMAFMGVGSLIAQWINEERILESFIAFELALALIGGCAVPLLYFSYAQGLSVQLISALLTGIIGVLVGLEIPLLSRLMAKHYSLKANLSNVLSIDYFGALIATLAFPFVLLPWLGVFKTSLTFGLINLSIALTLLWYFFGRLLPKYKYTLRLLFILVLILLCILMWFSKPLNDQWNDAVYGDRVVHSEQSQYQQLVVTRYKDDIRLYLNGGLQFSSIDEYRYHESLIHPAMSRARHAKNVLILGGGDGLAVRELLKYEQIERITLVDLDPAVASLARENHHLLKLNLNALNHPKVSVVHEDGFVYIAENAAQFDVIFADLPDPKNVSLARLYSKQFYLNIKQRLAPGGIFVTQATSPFFATKTFWSIHNTIASAGYQRVLPYHINVPSFGEWGFVMACVQHCPTYNEPNISTRFYSANIDRAMTIFPNDMTNKHSKVSTLDRPDVLHYYLAGWKYWN